MLNWPERFPWMGSRLPKFVCGNTQTCAMQSNKYAGFIEITRLFGGSTGRPSPVISPFFAWTERVFLLTAGPNEPVIAYYL